MERLREADDLFLHLKGLVFVRALLEERGASTAEIQEHSDEIERLRDRIAQLVRTTGGGAQRAAA
ncbi:MAG: hypothetical protein E6G08_07380 [Actinobacteria bacterium]|nr:MAG: hypothetical protein E6G08_07380 [Actinomycetota bacterium]